MEKQATRRGPGWAVYLVTALVVVFLGLFIFELLTFDESGSDETPVATGIAADAVTGLVAAADPERGAALVVEFTCTTCHVEGAVNGIAPPFEGIAGRAPSRQPDVPPELYLYRSIVHPTEYLVPGFSPSMPQDFADRMTTGQIADIVAYLLTQ